MEYNLKYSGPILFNVKISNPDILRIKKLCEKNKHLQCNDKLAGLIEGEYNITDLQALCDILSPYMKLFRENVILPTFTQTECFLLFYIPTFLKI